MPTGQGTPLCHLVLPSSGKSISSFLIMSCLDLILPLEMCLGCFFGWFLVFFGGGGRWFVGLIGWTIGFFGLFCSVVSFVLLYLVGFFFV